MEVLQLQCFHHTLQLQRFHHTLQCFKSYVRKLTPKRGRIYRDRARTTEKTISEICDLVHPRGRTLSTIAKIATIIHTRRENRKIRSRIGCSWKEFAV